MLIPGFQLQTAAWKRWLGLLLGIFILYGTTVEAAHRHGGILSAANGAASLVDPEQTSSPINGRTGCGDCLICQLHQNFNTPLVAIRLIDPTQQTQISITAVVALDVLSQRTGPAAGRAPPFIS